MNRFERELMRLNPSINTFRYELNDVYKYLDSYSECNMLWYVNCFNSKFVAIMPLQVLMFLMAEIISRNVLLIIFNIEFKDDFFPFLFVFNKE